MDLPASSVAGCSWGNRWRDEARVRHRTAGVHIAARRCGGGPLAARAQQSKVARIGALYIGPADGESFKKELREGLHQLGYVEGKNIAFEFRSADGKARSPSRT